MFKRHQRYVRLLHLYREDELHPRQRKALVAHLTDCEDCRRLQSAILRTEKQIAFAREAVQKVPMAEAMTSSILVRLRGPVRQTNILDRLSQPAARLAAAAVLVFMMAGFLTQEYKDQQRMQKLAGMNQSSHLIFVRAERTAPQWMQQARTVFSANVHGILPPTAMLLRRWLSPAVASHHLTPAYRTLLQRTLSQAVQQGNYR